MTAFDALGFIGLGVMGEAMCANIVRKADVRVHGADLNRDPVARLADIGMVPCGSAAEVAAAAECVFLSLPGARQVEQVCAELMAAPGRLRMVVDMSTAPAALARSLAAAFAAQGIDFVDAPVARLRQAARDGTLSIMVGGTEEAFARVRPTLAFMGSDVTHCGAAGAGQVAKALNNMVVFMTVQALAEAVAIARANGVDGGTLLDVLALGSADSFALRNVGMKFLAPDHFPPATFPVDYALKDIGYALDLARDTGLAPTGALTTEALLNAAKAAGFSEEYYPVFVKLIDGRAAVPAGAAA